MEYERIRNAIISMDDERIEALVREALEKKLDITEILEQGLIAGMKEVGKLFACKEYFVPEVLLASESFYAGFNIIKPLMKKSHQRSRPKIIMGVVAGDIHDIGKNIVKVMLEASGYDVIDLGRDVPISRFIESVATQQPAILALSSLMTTTMMLMTDIMHELEKTGLRNNVKVIVGGAPVTEGFAARIGADGYGKDAAAAVQIVDRLISG